MQGHHQEQDAVRPPELVSGHHQTEQGMGRSRYPHLAGQYGAQMLQYVGVTPGTGKTHLLIALGTIAAEQGRRVRYLTCAQLVNELAEAADDKQLTRVLGRYARLDLLCLDEIGYLTLDPRGAELLFQIITAREERASIACASNAPFSEWGNTFTDPRLAAAVVDRLTFNAHIIQTGIHSYRLTNTRNKKGAANT